MEVGWKGLAEEGHIWLDWLAARLVGAVHNLAFLDCGNELVFVLWLVAAPASCSTVRSVGLTDHRHIDPRLFFKVVDILS
jgi:hypothetical protein